MSTIYEPKTMNSLLSIIKKYPDSFIYSSGLEEILKSKDKTISFNKNIIYIEKIEELLKIRRAERFIEIGVAVKINHILDKGKKIIPEILLKALEGIMPPNFRNILTIGDMLCYRKERSSIYSVLSILDAKLEVRSSSSSKWISISHLFNGNEISLGPGEIITKIKLYLGDYDINIYREINNDFSSSGGPITFSALVSLAKENISFIKFIFSISDTFVIRNKEIEADLTGQDIPINEKLAATVISQFSESLDKKYDTIKTHKKNIIVNTLKWFINELDYYYY